MNAISTASPQRPLAMAWACKLVALLHGLAPLADLALRLYVANVFFKSGLTKIQSWDSTLALFTYEYSVPLLAPETAAALGTATELFFPVLLALGLAGRLSAAVLFVFNIVAVLSYPSLNPAGVEQHLVWGLMLCVSLLHGPGRISVDHLIVKRFVGGC
ncbi:MAG: DoxX family protein [Gammaproteobacteria bacterium]